MKAKPLYSDLRKPLIGYQTPCKSYPHFQGVSSMMMDLRKFLPQISHTHAFPKNTRKIKISKTQAKKTQIYHESQLFRAKLPERGMHRPRFPHAGVLIML